MWPWIALAALCLVMLLVVVLLNRRATQAVITRDSREGLPPIEEVAALLQELEDAGEAIIARLESKKAEADALMRLIDAKLDTMQLAIQATKNNNAPMQQAIQPPSERLPEATEANSRNEQVRVLVEAGLDPLAIAQRTGIRLDEVRLMINLQARQGRSGV